MRVVWELIPNTCLLTVTYIYQRQISNCMIIFNFCVSPVRTQMTNTEKINISEISMQNSLICMSVIRTKANHVYILRMWVNQKVLRSMYVIHTIANQKAFI